MYLRYGVEKLGCGDQGYLTPPDPPVWYRLGGPNKDLNSKPLPHPKKEVDWRVQLCRLVPNP